MKQLKKSIICLLSMMMLCSSQLVYASTSLAPVSENEVMPRFTITQEASSGGCTVVFHFTYSDGNSADCYAVFPAPDGNCTLAGPPTVYFAGERCYASVVAVNSTTGAQVTLRAWCDIYGDSAQY